MFKVKIQLENLSNFHSGAVPGLSHFDFWTDLTECNRNIDFVVTVKYGYKTYLHYWYLPLWF